MKKYLEHFNIPNFFSFIRVPLVVFWFIYLNDLYGRLFILAIAIFSDFLDGFLARRLNKVSPFGAVLDSICDKIFLVAAIISLFYLNHVSPYLYPLVLLRDILLTLLTIVCLILTTKRVQVTLRARLPGKAVTFFQFILTFAMLFEVSYINYIVYLIAFISIIAFIDYSLNSITKREAPKGPLSGVKRRS